MLKRVAADAIEFRELYFSMDPRFRDWEHEKTIDQVWQGILSGKTDALEAGDHFASLRSLKFGSQSVKSFARWAGASFTLLMGTVHHIRQSAGNRS